MIVALQGRMMMSKREINFYRDKNGNIRAQIDINGTCQQISIPEARILILPRRLNVFHALDNGIIFKVK